MVAVLFSILLFISACKAPDTNSPEPDTLQKQSLNFSINHSITLAVGTHITNTARGEGAGLIVYQSANPNIASVDSNGVITGITAGTTTIKATIAADEQFQSATASYAVTVTGTTVTATIHAWVGVEESEITVTSSSDLTGIELYRSSEPDCDLSNYSLCANGSLTNLTHSANGFIDTAFRLGSAGNYTFVANNNAVTHTLSTAKPRSSDSQKLIYFNNQFWAFGDSTGKFMYRPAFNWPYEGKKDVWTSKDGINWIHRTADQELFFNRSNSDFQVVQFKDKLWLIRDKQVWSSTNGINWTNITDNAGFSARNHHQVVIFNDKFWLIGGLDKEGYRNDVWSSSNGAEWILETANAAFSARGNHHLLAYNNQLWIIGGQYSQDGYYSDVWSSGDGVQWQEISNNPGFVSSANHKTMAFSDKLWIFGSQEVWSSTDGAKWEKEPLQASFLTTVRNRMTIRNNQIWNISEGNDVWLSDNGTEWKNLNVASPFPIGARQFSTFNSKLHLFRNQDTEGVWVSSDGLNWVEEPSDQIYPPRQKTQMVEFRNKLWIFGGGYEYSNTWIYDAWSSSDGIHWTEATTDKPFFPRRKHQIVTYKNKLWLIGGENDGDFFNDVWSSVDGTSWVRETANAGFPPRRSFQVVEFNDRLWLIGGDTTDEEFNDVWSSTDGVNWTQEVANAPFMSRSDHRLVVFDSKLWLIGGYNLKPWPGYSNLSDIWSSADGLQWTMELGSESGNPKHSIGISPFPATGLDVVVLHNKLWLISGSTVLKRYNGIWSSKNGTDWRLGYKMEINLP